MTEALDPNSATTLYEYFTSMGESLPSIADRSILFQRYGLGGADTYTGTASQNNALLACFQGRSEEVKNSGDAEALQILEPLRDYLESTSIGTIADAIREAMNDPEVVQPYLALANGLGLGLDTVQGLLNLVDSFPRETSYYDFFLSFIKGEESGSSMFDGPVVSPLDSVFDVPMSMQWIGWGGEEGSFQYSSPSYSVNAATQSYRIAGLPDDVLAHVDSDDLKFYQGAGADLFTSTASLGLTNAVFSTLKRYVSAPVYSLLSTANDVADLWTELKSFHTDALNYIDRSMEVVSSGNYENYDPSFGDRITSFQGSLRTALLNKFGTALGGDAGGIAGHLIGKSLFIEQHSDISFIVQDAHVSTVYRVASGHSASILGSMDADMLIGNSGADALMGLQGGDTLQGEGGGDLLDGGAGIDTMIGGDGSDTYYVRDAGDVVTETNATVGTGGTDMVCSYLSTYTLGSNVENGRIMRTGAANLAGNGLNNVLYAGSGNNVLAGGAGVDTVSYAFGQTGTTGVTVSLAVTTGQATRGSGSDTLTGIENLIGSSYADRLTGSRAVNLLDGGRGLDTMIGGDGSDAYYVRDAGDVVTETNATASTGGTDGVYSYLSTYTLGANVENGRIMANGAAILVGNGLNNILYAGKGNNLLNGGAGTDTVSYAYGLTATTGVTVSLAAATTQATRGSGSDRLIGIENLIGSAYADILTGSSGNNVIAGGVGKDMLKGNGGNDTFDFNTLGEMGTTSESRDIIVDFNVGDRIDLSTLDAVTATAANDSFVFRGSGAFTAAGQLRFDAVAHVLYGSTDADSTAEFAIALTGVSSLSASALVL